MGGKDTTVKPIAYLGIAVFDIEAFQQRLPGWLLLCGTRPFANDEVISSVRILTIRATVLLCPFLADDVVL